MPGTHDDQAASRIPELAEAGAEPASAPPAADQVLLRAFAQDGSRAALDELVRRYSGMVHATCLRILRHPQAADDAAQATFLVLMRRAAALPGGVLLPQWLYVT